MSNSDKRDVKLVHQGELVVGMSSSFFKEGKLKILAVRMGYKKINDSELSPCKVLVCFSDQRKFEKIIHVLEIVNVQITRCNPSCSQILVRDGFFGVITDDIKLAEKSVANNKQRVALVLGEGESIDVCDEVLCMNFQSISVDSLEEWIIRGKKKETVDLSKIKRDFVQKPR